jgi:ribose transport system ATP-binding protein/rhamnose transport system ATP-binding protein
LRKRLLFHKLRFLPTFSKVHSVRSIDTAAERPQPIAGPDQVAAAPVLALKGASKRYGGVLALDRVSLELRPGEVLALLGENGAGKSTCVRLLAGEVAADEGAVEVDGQPTVLASPQDALLRGIAVVHQHPALFADLSVAENIFMGHALTDRWQRLRQGEMEARSLTLMQRVGLSCSPRLALKHLRSSEQQMVEIARALSVDARVLIMDEPTASLSQREVERLFVVVNQLRRQGVAMLFVGHRMEEIYRLADRIAVLRDGKLIATEPAHLLTQQRAVSLMVGRTLSTLYPPVNVLQGEVVLEVEGLSRSGEYEGVNFQVRAGEVLGLGGLVGSGRTEIARTLFGINRPHSGVIRMDGQALEFQTPAQAMAAGVAYVSEDRLGQSLVMDFSIQSNASVAVLDSVRRFGLLQPARELAAVAPQLDRMELRFQSYAQPVKTLSGGNQQKVVLAKWLATQPRVLILDEPTQGIDVQAKAQVHAMVAELARQGMAIILISSELPELLGMCARIVVLREGRQMAVLPRALATQENILAAATDAQLPEQAAVASGLEASSAAANDQLAGLTVAAPTLASPLAATAGTTATPAPTPSAPRHPWIKLLTERRELGLVLAILAMVIPVTAWNPRMLSASNLTALSLDASLLIMVAAAEMLVILTRSIDLSVASIIGLSAYLSAALLRDHPELGIGSALLLACAVGSICGLLNGLLVTRGKVPAIVATLGTMTLFRGITSLWANGSQVGAHQVPQAWLDLTSYKVMGVPGLVFLAATTVLALAYGLRNYSMGRELFAVGSNPESAQRIGIPIANRVLGAFVMAGFLCGLVGALWASRYATIDARAAFGYELTVIAAVVVGGVAICGGAGTMTGMCLGALTLLVIKNGLTLVRVDPLWLQAVYGLVILIAIGVDAYVLKKAAGAARSAA